MSDKRTAGQANARDRDCAMVWMHIGDFHLAVADEPNHPTSPEMITQANENLVEAVDFAIQLGPDRCGRKR